MVQFGLILHIRTQKYLIDISLEIARAGFDEVQFDYVRFPEGGKGGAIYYSYAEEKLLRETRLLPAQSVTLPKKTP